MKMMIKMAGLAVALAISPVAFSSAAIAGPTYTGLEGNVAVSGYDVMSYYIGSGKPVIGSAKFKVQYLGAEYHFANAENAQKFQADPAAFVPQYGGHCAWAMSRGALAPADPTKYKLVDGKLYLNFDQRVQDMWLADIPGFIKKADAKWPTIPDTAKFGG
jgi:YHS domain-containing protein